MGWALVGTSVTGTAHRARGTPCQDASRQAVLGATAEWLVIAVADGAGSAAHSAVGAQLACDELIRGVETAGPARSTNPERMAALFAGARRTLLARAADMGVPARELACTALLAVVGPAEAAFGQVGDGAIVVRTEAAHRVVFWPEPAEYANATDFLTDDRFAETLRTEAVSQAILDVGVLTDGLHRLALDIAARAPHPAFFQPLFRQLAAVADPAALVDPLRAFLDSPRINERTDDDKTLMVAVRRP